MKKLRTFSTKVLAWQTKIVFAAVYWLVLPWFALLSYLIGTRRTRGGWRNESKVHWDFRRS